MEILSIKRVCERIGVSRQTLWKMTKSGKFPQPVNIHGSRVGYPEPEVDNWIASRIAERDGVAA